MFGTRKLRKARFIAIYPLVLAFPLFFHITRRTFFAGLALCAVGEIFRLWANGFSGHSKVNRTKETEAGVLRIGRLVTAGPYAIVRNPLYFGTFLIALGLSVAGGSIYYAAAVGVVIFWIYRKKILQEESLLSSEYGEEYASYCKKVPRYFPSFFPYSGARGEWKWEGIHASKEWKTLLWLVAIFILFDFIERYMNRGELAFSVSPARDAFFIALGVACVAVDLYLTQVARAKK